MTGDNVQIIRLPAAEIDKLIPKPPCPLCKSDNVQGYDGLEWEGGLLAWEPLNCEDCGATFDMLWSRHGIDQDSIKRPPDTTV
jgi:predicted Zn-ribbon and HTH transcriptional regulator